LYLYWKQKEANVVSIQGAAKHYRFQLLQEHNADRFHSTYFGGENLMVDRDLVSAKAGLAQKYIKRAIQKGKVDLYFIRILIVRTL
jgi:hypothetical protein